MTSKKYTITSPKQYQMHVLSAGNDVIRSLTIDGPEQMQVTDGYHTMDELYEHRIGLYITLCNQLEGNNHPEIWRSKLHSDGTGFSEWYILGINFEAGKQITYHIPMSRWDDTSTITELPKAPKWDGHTPADVLERLKTI